MLISVRFSLKFYLAICAFGVLRVCVADVKIDDYGLLPMVHSVAISPSGEHVAYIRRTRQSEYLVVGDLNSQHRVGGANTANIKAQSVRFLSNNTLLLRGGHTTRIVETAGAFDYSTAIIYDLETRKIGYLPDSRNRGHLATPVLGRAVGFDKDGGGLLLPSIVNPGSISYGLMRLDVDDGKAEFIEEGVRYLRDWFTDKSGAAVAYETYDKTSKQLRVFVKKDEEWRAIYEKNGEDSNQFIQAISAGGGSLMFVQSVDNQEGVYSLSVKNGEITGPLYVEKGARINTLLTQGINREFIGVEYSGLMNSSTFVEDAVDAHFKAVADFFPASSIKRIGSSDDKSKSVYLVSGNKAANSYYVLDAETMNLSVLGREYPSIKEEDIAEVEAVRYKARDGFSIGAVVTWPVGVEARSELPLIVMPHSLPDAHDTVRFNWMAQYLARIGYAVLQPNYRGSFESGVEPSKTGKGLRGLAAQDDISDGVKALVDSGQVDAERVCIVGAEFGGYSALAGVAFNSDLYQCAVSVGGVFDVGKMLKKVPSKDHARHWVARYWRDSLGASREQRRSLEHVSPLYFAHQVNAPVLLIHGNKDRTIPLSQSKLMYRALDKAGKNAHLVLIKGDGDWRTRSNGRIRVLQELRSFLNVHNPSVKSSD